MSVSGFFSRLTAGLFFGLCIYSAAFAETKPDAPKCGPAIQIEKPGLSNFHKVADNLYRGAQPTSQGLHELKNMGITTVINLRSFHSDIELNAPVGMSYEHIPMVSWRPEKKDIVRFLKIVKHHQKEPIFVHCQHGADRTGISIAVYRIVFCGLTKEEAIREMTEGGFGFHKIWQNLIEFVKNIDIESVRKEAEIR